MKTWPESGPRRTPPDDEVLRPLVEFFGARFKVVRNGGVAGICASYDGYPIKTSSCDDPDRFFSDEHRLAREKDGRPFTTIVELVLLAAFELGREYERRTRRQASAPAPGGVVAAGPGVDVRGLQRQRDREAKSKRYKDGRNYW